MSGNDWISVKDKLPEDSEKCIVQYELRKFGRDSYGKYRQEVTVCIYNSDLNFWYATTDASTITDVVAWQPIPKFYVDPNIPHKGDYGIFDGEKWVNMRTDIPVEFNIKKFDESLFLNRPYTKEEAESRLNLLKEIHDDLARFCDRLAKSKTWYWTPDRIDTQLSYYFTKLDSILNPDEST